MSADACAALPEEQAGAAARRLPRRPPPGGGAGVGRHSGPLAPRAVPCSALGVKDIHAARTMGPPSGAELVTPSKWLHPHEKEPRLPQPAKPAPKERRKAPLPAKGDVPAHGLSSGTDFVTANVAQAAAAPPKFVEQEEVRYVFKPHFGELPPYLRQRKRELEAAAAAAAVASAVPAHDDGGAVLQGEALAELVRHMKLKWQSLNEAYVRLPCVLDTPSKRRRKEELEAQLAEIERDVRMLSRATSVRVTSE